MAEVLIVGAGPTGLAAALLLTDKGVRCRVVEKRLQPNDTSNALAVNPRTLELLAPTGVSAAIEAEGLPLHHLLAHQDGRRLAEVALHVEEVGARHPLTILPQPRTEAHLAEALAARGVPVERGLELKALSQTDTAVEATLAAADGRTQAARADILFSGDGAHSAVRHALGLGFPGSAFPETWRVTDVRLAAPQDPHAHLDFRRSGAFLAFPYSPTHWRLIGTEPALETRLPAGWTLDKMQWTSEFKLSHRLAERLNVGRVCLGGDAAHVHAPVGGRGMNLGIEDAYVFAELAAQALAGRPEALADYGRLRHETDGGVVRLIDRMTGLVRSNGAAIRAVRPLALPALLALRPVRHVMTRMVAGLDHPVRLA